MFGLSYKIASIAFASLKYLLQMHFIKAIFLFLNIFYGYQSTQGAKILAVFPYAGPSQYILVQPFLKALAARGHELTVINAFPQKQKIDNFRDVVVDEVLIGYGMLKIA